MNALSKYADAGACGTCRTTVGAGEPVTHDECAARAALLQAPDHPDYEDLLDLTDDERQALPARFHTPQFEALGKPNMWLCAVCWGDGWVTQWPCKTAQENGAQVFTDQTRTTFRAEVLAERDAQVVAWLAKKAAGYGSSNREARTKADAVALMADKLSRGAVRDDETGVSELYRLSAENNRLRARIAELEAERHSTNEALSDAAETIRAQRDRIAELETHSRKAAREDMRPGERHLAERAFAELEATHWKRLGTTPPGGSR